MASTATTSVINGIRNGDSAGKIVADTAKNTLLTAATCAAPKVINKFLSGKYAKLNKVEKFVKKITSGPYQPKYSSGPNHLADALANNTKRAGIGFLKSSANLGWKYFKERFFS